VTLAKMIEIAELLDAVVQGDDGEEYTVTDEGEIVGS
jgi:antitoxin (DNA-binding transcriptional repressor) of toxin-antitoxin stability system